MRPIVSTVTACLAFAIASVAVVSSGPAALAQNSPPQGDTAQEELKQIPLTDAQIQHFLAAHKDVDALLSAVPDNGDPDAATLAKVDAIAKKNGFASGAEYQTVSGNIELVMAGIDPQTKKYIGAETMVKQQIAQVQADKSIKPKDKTETIEQLKETLKTIVPVQNPGNIEIVTKYFDKLSAAVSED